jgi:hypothetical protein
MSANNDLFPCVRVEGAILPADLLQRIAAGDKGLEGLRPEDYHLVGEKVNEATSHAWTRLSHVWEEFRPSLDKPPPAADESVTLKKWLLPLWQALGYGQLDSAKPFEIDGKQYPISHIRYHSPIHLVGFRQDLDKRVETAGGKRPSPHGMVQEFLNRSEAHLWAFVSNGLKLRVLRDNIRLTRQAFVEFDLQCIFDGKAYADFALLWRLCHESRVRPEKAGPDGAASDNPADCWLERWSKAAAELGLRALDQLRDGVERAVEALGRGFLNPRNVELIRWLRDREPHAQEYYRQLLRVVYRLLFLFVAEDRGLLLSPSASEAARERYTRFYSTARLRRIAEQTRGTPHTDLYQALELVLNPLGRGGCPALGLSELGGLFDPAGTPNLSGCVVGNADLLEAVRALAVVSDGKSQRSVDYRNLGSEELGSVYESLLELKPHFTADPPSFDLKTAAGNERKTTGSYYTPTSLINSLLDSALDSVLEEAARKPDAEAALLNLKVCDPAVGSGHFLIAASHRIARRLAAVRTQEEEPAPDAVRHALRDVIGKCVYGVDVNPMAVELCQVALWMEAMEPGRPLSFLKHRIQCGNSLLGATPALLEGGIPDEAFEPIQGDDKAYCREWKKTNRREREERQRGQTTIEDLLPRLGNFAAEMAALDTLPDDTPDQVRAKAERYDRLASESNYRTSGRFWADVWCAAFVWRKAKGAFDYPITERIFRQVERNPHDVTPWMYAEVVRLRDQYQFFHWHLAFPGVFRPPTKGEKPDNQLTGWCGGFDVVLGNPPWERVKLQEQEWFAAHGRSDIAQARTASIRGRMIKELEATDSVLCRAFLEDRRAAEGESNLVRQSGRYPLCGRGDVNTYSVFAELNRNLSSPTGKVGCIVPTGIATDDTTKDFFKDIVGSRGLASLFGFENEEFIFPGVHHSTKFCLLTLSGAERPQPKTDFVFFARQVEHLSDPARRFALSTDELALLSPNTGACPVFRSARDAELTKAIYRRVPVLIRESGIPSNPWGVRFLRMLDMANDSGLFRTAKDLSGDGWKLDGNVFRIGDDVCLPLYEAKMFHQFDHRWGTYEGQTDSQANQGKLPELTPEEHADPQRLALPRYWVPAEEVGERLKDRWDKGWLVAWRDICRNTDSRTTIASVLPRVGVGHTSPLMFPDTEPTSIAGLYGCLCSFVFDYAARQKVGGTHLTFGLINQLPVLPPARFSRPCSWSPPDAVAHWLLPRVVELAYTAWDLQPFAADCGFDGPPFRWDEDRRFQLRCEFDAAYFHLYLGTGDWQQVVGEPDADFARLKEAFPTPRHAVEYVMGTFPVVRQQDEQAHGRYRTKEQILAVYDALAEAARTGQPYRSPLDPPPADPRCRHADREGTIAPGAVRTLADLLTALPDGPFPLRLTEADLGPGQPVDWTCQPLTDGEPMPPEGTWVLLRSDGLRRGPTPLAIAAGRLALNPIAGGMEVMLKGAIPPATLRLTAEQWKSFRPLAVLTPLALPE